MLISLLTYLLISNALTMRKDKSILFSRVLMISLILTAILAINNLSVTCLDKSISIYGGLFHVTPFTQSFNIFIFIISAIILIFTSFYPRKVFIKQYSSISKLLFYNFIYNKTKTIIEMSNTSVLKTTKKTIKDLTIKKIVFIVVIRIFFMLIFTYVIFPLLISAKIVLHPYLVNTIFYNCLCFSMFSVIFYLILIYLCLYITLEKAINSLIIKLVASIFTLLTLSLLSTIPTEIFIILYPFTPLGFEQEFLTLKTNGNIGGTGGNGGSGGTGGSGGRTPGNGGSNNPSLLHSQEQRTRSNSDASSESYYSDTVQTTDTQLVRNKKLGNFLYDMDLKTDPYKDRKVFDQSNLNPMNWDCSSSAVHQRVSQEIEARLIYEHNDRISKAAQGIQTYNPNSFTLSQLGITSSHPLYGTIRNILYPRLHLGSPSVDDTVIYSPIKGPGILKAIRSGENC